MKKDELMTKRQKPETQKEVEQNNNKNPDHDLDDHDDDDDDDQHDSHEDAIDDVSGDKNMKITITKIETRREMFEVAARMTTS